MLLKVAEGALKNAQWPTRALTGHCTFEMAKNT